MAWTAPVQTAWGSGGRLAPRTRGQSQRPPRSARRKAATRCWREGDVARPSGTARSISARGLATDPGTVARFQGFGRTPPTLGRWLLRQNHDRGNRNGGYKGQRLPPPAAARYSNFARLSGSSCPQGTSSRSPSRQSRLHSEHKRSHSEREEIQMGSPRASRSHPWRSQST